MIRKGRLIICVAVLFVLQATLAHRFSQRFLRVDLLYVVVVYLALEADFKGALWSAFLVGLLRDLGSCGRLGASALLFVAATWGTLWLRSYLVRESIWTDLVLVFAYVLLCELAYGLGTAALIPAAQAADLLPRALGQAIFTTAISPLLFAGFIKGRVVDKSLEALDAAA